MSTPNRASFRAHVAGKLTRRAALDLSRELESRAHALGSYGDAWREMLLPVADAWDQPGQRTPQHVTRARWHGLLLAGARGKRTYAMRPEVRNWTAYAAAGSGDEAFRALAHAFGVKRWGPKFTLDPIPAGQQAQPGQPGQPGQAGQGAAPAPEQPEPAQGNGQGNGQGPEQAGAPGWGLGLIPGHASGLGETYAPDDPRRHDRARHVDRARVEGWARRLRSALAGAITSAREPDQATGRYVNRSALARLGAGATLRPFERTRRAHAPSTAIALALDCSGSMGAVVDNNLDPWTDATQAEAAARGRGPTNHLYMDERATSAVVACRMAALAVSDACARTIPLRLSMYDGSAYELAGWSASPAERERALLETYGALGGTDAPSGALDMLNALAKRREARKVGIILCDGALGAGPQWVALAARADALGIELHLICADWPDNHIERTNRSGLPESITARIQSLTMDTTDLAAEEIVRTTEGALRREARAWAT